MSNRNELAGLADEEVLSGVVRIVARCNELTGELLAHLAEVESRMLYAELGFPNLFSYCVELHGFSEGAAARRCRAARVCARFPEALDLVARGELHLSALYALSDHLEPENAVELFAACRRKSRRKVDEILAARFPKADAKEFIHPLPDGVGSLPRNQEIQPTSADRYRVQFTADAKLRELIERACALCPDQSSQGQLANVVTRALEVFVVQQEKRRFAIGCRSRKAKEQVKASEDTGEPTSKVSKEQITPPGGVRRRRQPRAAVRREVYERDGGCCAWVARDGRRCAARVWVQFDHHLKPWAKGGGDGPDNLRLLCQAHNRLHARHCFGALHVAAKVAAWRARRGARSQGPSRARAGETAFSTESTGRA